MYCLSYDVTAQLKKNDTGRHRKKPKVPRNKRRGGTGEIGTKEEGGTDDDLGEALTDTRGERGTRRNDGTGGKRRR